MSNFCEFQFQVQCQGKIATMSKSRAKSKGRKSKKGSSEEAEHIVEFGRAGFSFNYGCQFPVEEAANQIKIKATKVLYRIYTCNYFIYFLKGFTNYTL